MKAERFIAADVVRAEIGKFANDILAEAIGIAIKDVVEERCAALEAKINQLEAAMEEFTFRGQWIEGKEYKRGNFCSHGGAIFHCNTDTKAKPGNSSDWTLAAARGRDGKDYMPPEPRTVRSGR